MSEVQRYYINLSGREVADEEGYLVYYYDYDQLEAENARYREALESISKNTCCDSCQEASKWAKQALEETQ